MLQVVRVVVHGICIRPSELALLFDLTHLTNVFIRNRREMKRHTPATMQQHASRTAKAAEVSISIEAVLATLYAFDAENVPSLALTFILSRYHIA